MPEVEAIQLRQQQQKKLTNKLLGFYNYGTEENWAECWACMWVEHGRNVFVNDFI